MSMKDCLNGGNSDHQTGIMYGLQIVVQLLHAAGANQNSGNGLCRSIRRGKLWIDCCLLSAIFLSLSTRSILSFDTSLLLQEAHDF